jgi:hypothetical protein
MYYVLGPVLALLISLKYTQQQSTKDKQEYQALAERIELLEKRTIEADKEMLQKIMTTVMPIAKAVNKLNQEVGL